MIDYRVDGQVHGRYTVTMRCSKCNLAVFSGQSNDRENVEKVIRNKFYEIHVNCDSQEIAQ